MAATPSLEGRCHRGALSWQHQGMPESATACNCSSCRRWSGLWACGTEGDRIQVRGESKV